MINNRQIKETLLPVFFRKMFCTINILVVSYFLNTILWYIRKLITCILSLVNFKILILNARGYPNIFHLTRQSKCITICLIDGLLKLCLTNFLFFTFNKN